MLFPWRLKNNFLSLSLCQLPQCVHSPQDKQIQYLQACPLLSSCWMARLQPWLHRKVHSWLPKQVAQRHKLRKADQPDFLMWWNDVKRCVLCHRNVCLVTAWQGTIVVRSRDNLLPGWADDSHGELWTAVIGFGCWILISFSLLQKNLYIFFELIGN